MIRHKNNYYKNNYTQISINNTYLTRIIVIRDQNYKPKYVISILSTDSIQSVELKPRMNLHMQSMIATYLTLAKHKGLRISICDVYNVKSCLIKNNYM